MLYKPLRSWEVYAETIPAQTPIGVPFVGMPQMDPISGQSLSRDAASILLYDQRSAIRLPSITMTPGHTYIFQGSWDSDPEILPIESYSDTYAEDASAWVSLNLTDYRNWPTGQYVAGGAQTCQFASFTSTKTLRVPCQEYLTVAGGAVYPSTPNPHIGLRNLAVAIAETGYSLTPARFSGTIYELDSKAMRSLGDIHLQPNARFVNWDQTEDWPCGKPTWWFPITQTKSGLLRYKANSRKLLPNIKATFISWSSSASEPSFSQVSSVDIATRQGLIDLDAMQYSTYGVSLIDPDMDIRNLQELITDSQPRVVQGQLYYAALASGRTQLPVTITMNERIS